MSILEKEPSDPNRLKTFMHEAKSMFLRSYLYKLLTEGRKHDSNRQKPVELCQEITIIGMDVSDKTRSFLKDVANSYLLRKKQNKIPSTGLSYTHSDGTIILHRLLEKPLHADLIKKIEVHSGQLRFPHMLAQTAEGSVRIPFIIVPEEVEAPIRWLLNN